MTSPPKEEPSLVLRDRLRSTVHQEWMHAEAGSVFESLRLPGFDFYFGCIDSASAPEACSGLPDHTSALQSSGLHLEPLLCGVSGEASGCIYTHKQMTNTSSDPT